MYRVPGFQPDRNGCIPVECSDTSHYSAICQQLFDHLYDDPNSDVMLCPGGRNLFWAPPIILHQTKIICTDEYWLPAWNFIVHIMRQDVQDFEDFDIRDVKLEYIDEEKVWDDGRGDFAYCRETKYVSMVDSWALTVQELAICKKELEFWASEKLWAPHFSKQRALKKLNDTSKKLCNMAHETIHSLQNLITDQQIPKCLFIKHMYMADMLLRSIFRKNFGKEPDHIICMILTHLYMKEHPNTCIFYVVPPEKRARFLAHCADV